MKDLISCLKKIENDSKKIGLAIKKESYVSRLELEDRLRKGLSGQAAIDHYNDWMQRYDMPHLMV